MSLSDFLLMVAGGLAVGLLLAAVIVLCVTYHQHLHYPRLAACGVLGGVIGYVLYYRAGVSYTATLLIVAALGFVLGPHCRRYPDGD